MADRTRSLSKPPFSLTMRAPTPYPLAPRAGAGRHPLTGLILATLLMLCACDNANASEASRTYRPLSASCAIPPQTSGAGLQPVVFFDDDEALSEDDLDEDSSPDADPLEALLALGEDDATAHLLSDQHAGDEEPFFGAPEQAPTTLMSAELHQEPATAPSDDRFDVDELDTAELDTAPVGVARADHARENAHVEAASQPREQLADAPETPADMGDEPRSGRVAHATSLEAAGADAPVQKININTATEADLTSIRGIGPALARRILDYRSRRPFTRLSHLKRVKGIGPATYQRLEPYITLEDPPDEHSTPAQN